MSTRENTSHFLSIKEKGVQLLETFFLTCAMVVLLQPLQGLAQQNPGITTTGTQATATQQTPELRDGQHDFDFHVGTWKSHIKRLLHPLTGSTTWIDMQGTLDARKLWDGRAQIETLEADDATGHHIEDLLLFLYNPQSHQWSLNAAASSDGTIGTPMIGEFKNGRGEFFDQEPFHNRSILVRQVWSDITPPSHRFEQAFSDDGGKTWEVNFIANLERTN